MEAPKEAEEKLVFSFKIDNCVQEYYYQITICDDKDNFETEKILCEKGGESLTFQKKMDYIFLFEKRQKITLIISKQDMYSNEENHIGTAKFVYLADLLTKQNEIYETNLSEDLNTEKIQIKVQKSKDSKDKRYLFDYLKSGIKLSCFISFDFSQKKTSKIKEENLNILKNIFQSIEGYSADHLYYASGFGGKLKGSKIPVFDIDKLKLNSDKLIEKYKASLESNNIIPEKNIALSPIIKKITSDIYESYAPDKYYVLFLLLSKDIDKKDKKNLIHQIIASSYLPLSIFIIGIGNHDFTEAKSTLKKISKYSSEGMAKARDNIIFIINNSPITANKAITFCLKELSKQMIEYYIYNKYFPENDDNNNNNNIKDSINIYGSMQVKLDNNEIPSESNNSNSNSESQFNTFNSSPIETNKKETPNPTQINSCNPDIKNNNDNNNDNKDSINIDNTLNSNNINDNVQSSNNSNTNSYKIKCSDFYETQNFDSNPYNKKKNVEKSGASSSTLNSKNSGQ